MINTGNWKTETIGPVLEEDDIRAFDHSLFHSRKSDIKNIMVKRKKELLLKSLADLPKAAQALLAFAGKQKKMIFIGEIGAGKTTFIKALCQILGVKDAVTSPTFSLINEYSYLDENGKEQLLYHLDLYRLKNAQEALDIGIEDILYDDAYCFIEWPEIIADLLPDNVVKISLKIIDDSSRKILFL